MTYTSSYLAASLVNAFFKSNAFTSKARLKLTKNEAKAKQHPEVKVLLLQNYSLFSSTLSSKASRRCSRKHTKKQVRLNKWGYLINDNEFEAENKK